MVVVVVGRGWKVCNSVLLPTGSRCAMNSQSLQVEKKKRCVSAERTAALTSIFDLEAPNNS